jgi:hypothetical protein
VTQIVNLIGQAVQQALYEAVIPAGLSSARLALATAHVPPMGNFAGIRDLP